MAKAANRTRAGEAFPVRQAVIVAVVALVFRAVYWLLASKSLFLQTPVVDASFFDIWARTLAEGRVFQEAEFFKPPFYAYLLSWLYKAGFSLTGVLILQMLVGTLTVLLTLAIGRLVFSLTGRFRRGAGHGSPAHPAIFRNPAAGRIVDHRADHGIPAADPAGGQGKQRRNWPNPAGRGTAYGGCRAGATKPDAGHRHRGGWLWWRGRAEQAVRVSLGSLGLLLAGFLMAISPATFHNLRYGEFTLISANLGANLVAGNSDTADGVSAIPVGVHWDDLQLMSRQAGAASPASASRWLTGEAVRWMTAHPGQTLRWPEKRPCC